MSTVRSSPDRGRLSYYGCHNPPISAGTSEAASAVGAGLPLVDAHWLLLNIFQDNGLRVEIDNWMGVLQPGPLRTMPNCSAPMTVRRRRETGRLPAIKLGRLVAEISETNSISQNELGLGVQPLHGHDRRHGVGAVQIPR